MLQRAFAAPSRTLSKPQRFKYTQGFKSFIALIKEAEDDLIAAGEEDVGNRIHILRGIYYGATWSVDYNSERSGVRNNAFNWYTQSGEPKDPRPIIGQTLYLELLQCAEVYQSANEVFDFGHCIIGVDARRSYIARSVAQPLHGGGTGFEICTWLGDLGGGAGSLAMRRRHRPTERAKSMFKRDGSSFGSLVNIEGDVAAYLVARDADAGTGVASVNVDSNGFIATALEEYLLDTSGAGTWKERGKGFMISLGYEFDEDGKLTNEEEVTTSIVARVFEFSDLYMANWMAGHPDQFDIDDAIEASAHLAGASKEVSAIFISMLKACLAPEKLPLTPVGIDPSPTPRGKPLLKYVTAKKAETKAKEYLKEIEDWWKSW